jgi:SHAQKYF class myb-like DNA-binding protein
MTETPQEVDMDADGKQVGGASKQKKRFLWTDSLHQLFVAAIFDLGLQSATPKSLISLMNPRPDDITTDHIKSHLQKFRINLKISRDMFLRDYQAARAETDARFAEMAKAKGEWNVFSCRLSSVIIR